MPNSQDPRNIFVNQRNEYSEKTSEPHTERDTRQQQQQPSQSEVDKRIAEMKRLATKYEREGEGQLVRDIVSNVIEQKARGQLTNEQLIAFAKRVRPLLNEEQRTRLDALLEQLLKY